jgi:hypothetical protein
MLHWDSRKGHGLRLTIVNVISRSLPVVPRLRRSYSGLIFHHTPNGDEHLMGCDGLVDPLLAIDLLISFMAEPNSSELTSISSKSTLMSA